MDHHGQGATRLQHVEHGLGDALLVGPMERLPEGDQPIRPGRGGRKVLGTSLHPPDVAEGGGVSGPASLLEHVWVGVQADYLLEQVCEAEGQDARSTTRVEQPSGPVEAELTGEDGLEMW